jgi:hypothetical protein
LEELKGTERNIKILLREKQMAEEMEVVTENDLEGK